jgi:cobalt-zinc-cadmium efflux system outer membrane protein
MGHVQAESARCAERISRQNLVQCALAASALAEAAREGIQAVKGRERSVSALLPANPTISFSGDRRTSRREDATNWYGTLAQELEIAGQRKARREAVASELRAQQANAATTEREVTARALRAYFEVLAARDVLAISEQMERSFEAAAAAARAAAERGLSAGIEADLAELAAARLTQARIEAEAQHGSALAELVMLLGLDPAAPAPSVEGELVPLGSVDGASLQLAEKAAQTRPEVASASATRASYSSWASAYHRSRVPNLTVSVFAQRDGFDERVLGAGVSLPITLPSPVGRDFSGETAENEALARRAGALLEQTRRDVRLEVVQALKAWESATAALALYTPERLERATQSLEAIHREIAAGRVAVSSMIVPERELIAFLLEHVAMELALCLASVELTRSTGIAFEGALP